MTANRKDLLGGVLCILLGVVFAVAATLVPVGSMARMGPGYFPLIFACLLVLFGIAISANAFRTEIVEAAHTIPWRSILFVSVAPVVFGLTIRGLGLAPAVFVASLLASFGGQRLDLRFCLLLAAGLTALCVAVFHFGLGLSIPLVGPWLAGRS